MDQAGLTSLLREHGERHALPGASLGVLRDGVVTIACHGVGNLDTGEPITPHSRFSLGSLTKSFVATALARLTREGRLSLDDPAVSWVPELHRSPWAETTTLRDLLANRSGLPLTQALEFEIAERADRDDGALSRLAADVAGAAPSPGPWSYTNVGWCLLGRALETATGAPWEIAMARLLDSDMVPDTTYGADAAQHPRVTGYDAAPAGPTAVAPLVSRAYGPAGASAVSSAPDLLRFAEWHLDDPSLAVLREAHSDVAIHGWLDGWCLGWARFDWPGGPVWGWDSVVPGERAVLRLLPEHRAAVVLMTNSASGRPAYRSLFSELMPLLFGVEVTPLRLDASPAVPGDLSRFAGVYAWPDRRVEITAAGTGLLLTSGAGVQELHPIDDRTLVVDADDPDNPTVTFGSFDGTGRPRVIYDMLWGLPRRDGPVT